MKRSLLFLLLGLSVLLLAMTVFAQSNWIVPILITITFFSWLYSLFYLYQTKTQWGQLLVEFLLNLLAWP